MYNPVSVSVFEGNGPDKIKSGKTYQKEACVSVFCFESGLE